MLEFDVEYFEIKFKGEVVKLRFPSIRDSKKLRQDMKTMSEEDSVIEFLANLGLKKEYGEQMSQKQLVKLLEALEDKKK